MSEQESKVLMVSSSPHLSEPSTSKKIMFEVAAGCAPAVVASVYLFRAQALGVLVACIVGAILTEWLFNVVRKKPLTIGDGSAVVTGLILGLSLPPTLPLWMAVLGSVVAIGVAKMCFGGLGSNIFNPAMVGRAFLMASFGMFMTSWTVPAALQSAPVDGQEAVVAVSQPTPLATAKQPIKDAHNEDKVEKAAPAEANSIMQDMFLGKTGGSLGETSALCWLIGGLFLLWRKTITFHIPLAVLGTAMFIATLAWMINPDVYVNPLVHLFGGGLMMCAFFIATDPVSCPLTKWGRIFFGMGVGAMIMLIRLQGGYPEGVMYAVLLMNSMTPLLDGWTRPTPLGGHVRAN